MSFTHSEIKPVELEDNVFQAIGRDAMLITAGALESFNTMTASWGAVGHLWNRDVAFCFVRPQRYTRGFIDRAGYYTLSFFDPAYAAALEFCGHHSGRDVNKIAATGLTPVSADSGAVYFTEARLVLECRKLYAQDIDRAGFVEPVLPVEVYPKGDFHRMYVGEIVRCLVRQ